MKQNKKIIFTGGHFTTAVAVLEELKGRGYSNFFWIGHKYTMLKDKEPSFEYKEIKKMGVPFFDIKAGKLYRHPSLLGLISFMRIPLGFIQAFFILLKIKPDIILSFGGYLAVPVAISAYILGIPVITHEQTSVFGLSNKILSKISKKVMVSWPSSTKYFKNSVLTGNPIRQEVFIHDKNFIDFQNTLPTILVMGGNQGSHLLNMAIKDLIKDLSKDFNLIHQAGSNTIYNDYNLLDPLSEEVKNYKVFKGIWGEDFGRAINQASFVISRAGANTVYELAALGKKAILIPLEFSFENEQLKNANMLKDAGLAIIIEEKDLNRENLIQAIYSISQNANYSQNSKNLVEFNAASNISDIVEKSF